MANRRVSDASSDLRSMANQNGCGASSGLRPMANRAIDASSGLRPMAMKASGVQRAMANMQLGAMPTLPAQQSPWILDLRQGWASRLQSVPSHGVRKHLV